MIVSVRDVIFDKDTIWDRKPILYSDNNIKELDKAIVHIKIPKSKAKEMEDIWLVKDTKVDKPISIIIHQANYKNEDLDENCKRR